ELEGTDDTPYTPEQYRKLAQVANLAMAAWPDITDRRIAGHCDIAPGRKTDPGPAFDWELFAAVLDDNRSARKGV
ncbi:MAG: N-acetylmuramoyl-L-alanine amidase, partial [Moorella sp. (in: Bacteria)]|nr:N-acetylmuramoyl-L-alanine amidase [Moorella sp. (in: firmicutes)]